ncbi:hypothetical protein CPC08DRAFT_710344 [Agrocybe pediades]|nr:hypothetical protein CPC08DRAFT_710344 [Agrocybe pediades]
MPQVPVAATADEVLQEIEEQEEWENGRITAAKEVPRGEWASKKHPKHKYAPRSRVPELDNLRAILILVLIMYDSVLETIANSPENIEKEHPIQFAILSLFTGIYRTIVVSLFFYVSGIASWLCLVLHSESTFRFLVKKIRVTATISIGSYLASKGTEYMYGPFTEGRNIPYYASREGKVSLLQGPIYYAIMLLVLDILFVFCRYLHRHYWRYDLVERLVGTSRRFNTTEFIVMSVFVTGYPMFVLSGMITLPTRLQSFFIHVPFDAHTPFTFVLAYAAAVNQNHLQVVWLSPKGSARIPRHIIMVIGVLLTFSSALLLPLYHYYPSTIALYISPKLAPHPVLDAFATTGITRAAQLYAIWAALTYRSLLVTVASTLYTTGIKWFMKTNYRALTGLAYIQSMTHMFFVIGIARHSSWIGSPILRCIFVGSTSIICGWTTMIVPLFSYYLIRGYLSGGLSVEGEEGAETKEAEEAKEGEKDTPEAAPETQVETVVREAGGESKEVVATTEAETATQIGEATGGSEGKDVVSEKVGEVMESTGSEEPKQPVQAQTGENDVSEEDSGEDNLGHTPSQAPSGRKRILTLDIARAFMILLLLLHTSIGAVVANLPESFPSSSPKYFAAMAFFTAFHQVSFVPAFFFLSGISSYISLSTKYLKKSPFRLVWERFFVMLLVAYVDQLMASSISRLDRVWPPTAAPARTRSDLLLIPRQPGDLITLYVPVIYMMLLVPLDVGFCVLRTTTRHSERLSRLIGGRKRYFALQGIALCVQLVYLCAVLGQRDPFFSPKWRLDAHFPLLYVNAYAMGVNIPHIRAVFFNANSSWRSTSGRAVKRCIAWTFIAGAVFWVLYYRISPVSIPAYVDPRYHPHRVLDAGASQGSRGAVIAYACWSLFTFLLLTASIASFVFASDQPVLLSRCPQRVLHYVSKAHWYSFLHAAPAVVLAGRTGWIEGVGGKIVFVMAGSVVLVSGLMAVGDWFMTWKFCRGVVRYVKRLFKL